MLSVQQVASEFRINAERLLDESLRLYLHQQLIKIESELFRYAQKYGVKTVTELDEKESIPSLKAEAGSSPFIEAISASLSLTPIH